MAGPASSAISPGDIAGPGFERDGNAVTRRVPAAHGYRSKHARHDVPSRARLTWRVGALYAAVQIEPRTPALFGLRVAPELSAGRGAGTSVPAGRLKRRPAGTGVLRHDNEQPGFQVATAVVDSHVLRRAVSGGGDRHG